MTRLCERPGCSERGAIAYGFDAGECRVWLAPFDPDADRNRSGTLCVRHADAMVVPQGWILEDARDPMPRLFRPAPRQRLPRKSRRGEGRKAQPAPGEQLPLDEATAADEVVAADEAAASTVAAVTGVASGEVDPDATTSMPWMPDFDITDDLGGTLNAESPLLSRAFRGIGRHPS
jgi:hypothetical protein